MFVKFYDLASSFSGKVDLNKYLVRPAEQTLLGKSVLIAMFRANITSNFLDLLLYRELRARGASVKVVLCDGSAFPCDNITGISNVFNYRCLQCKAVQERFKKIIDPEDLLYVTPSAIPVQAPLSVNAVASAKRFDMSEDYDTELARRYQRTYMSVIELLRAQPKIDLVVMSHGLYATWGAFRDFCKDGGIDYITWGRTYFNKMLGVVKNSAFNEGPATYDRETLERVTHDEEYAALVDSLEARVNGGPARTDTVNYYAYLDNADKSSLRDDLIQIADGKPIVAVYLSIPWDGTVYGANGEFQSQRDLINSVVTLARTTPSHLFVFRVHPRESEMPEKAETHIKEALNGTILPNLTVIDPQAQLTSYELAEVASLNILYSGTLAIEFAYAGHPLVVCGKNLVYGIESVTVVDSIADLNSAIQSNDYSRFKPEKQFVKEGLRRIGAVLYHDDLAVSENYAVTDINLNSKLIHRIIKELVE